MESLSLSTGYGNPIPIYRNKYQTAETQGPGGKDDSPSALEAGAAPVVDA